MRRVVFYSWQSDLPNATNRGLIQAALEAAAEAIAGDEGVAVEPVIDRDTEGIAGAPDIASTIFAKINAADVVVADVSIVSAADVKRRTPNPNVMIEVGYALRALNFDRVLLVFNSAFGDIENLPFDLRMRRLVVYSAAQDDKDRATARRDLTRKFEQALRAALLQTPSAAPASKTPAVEAIEDQRPNRRIAIRAELAQILAKLDEVQPPKLHDGGDVVKLVQALSNAKPPVMHFSRIVEAAAVMEDDVAALETYRFLGQILERCDLPRGFSGAYNEADFDFFKFVMHELTVTSFAFLLREKQWVLVSRLLNEPIPVRYLHREHGPGNAVWSDLSRHVRQLGGESFRLNRLSVHGDILHERHSTGDLADVLPFEDFAASDFFLYLKGLLPPDKMEESTVWKPWSAVWLPGTPRFLLDAQSKVQADNIVRTLALPSIGELRKRLLERGACIEVLYRTGFWEYPVRQSDIDKIGSRDP